ncbi:Retrovirus-related Pol polyprotein from transposon TNT 1-94 [Senna tora]|uniref:Retrovirus-related Pol polyprotein from transposon TNT 1-94 n=1 Tax=Senna tora TaxID=362788 RepID=A0A834X8G2_9FABA|nr:Retrovirus-related Pol polyprotein from transposon TNT 1-94 [Senna tora]
MHGMVKRMADMVSSVSGMEKLNSNNYNIWSRRMRFYLHSQDLWSLVGEDETQHITEGDLKKWKVRASKAMYVLSMTMEDDILQDIKEAKTPKVAWDTLIDPQNPITETRMKMIIVHGLRLKFHGLVTATRGWAEEPTLIELENILANQGTRWLARKPAEMELKVRGAQGSQDDESRNEREKYRQEGRCYNCGRKRHFARECWRLKCIEENMVTSAQQNSEEECDFRQYKGTEEITALCIEEIEDEVALVSAHNNSINYEED